MKDHISVCICTYRRNRMLERLLGRVAAQDTGGLFDISVVVVDNDVAGPARETVMRLRDELGLDVTYGIEPEPVIPAVRNHALRLARGNYIGIIDDDEFPPQDWLLLMYRAIQTFDVDGVMGPVHPFFEQTPPAWLIKSRICERPAYRTGTLLRWNQMRTGNVLLKKGVFDKHGLCFDVKFAVGEDQAFFRDAMRAGCRFVAVKEAPVYEVVPPERWTKRYYLRRSLATGFNSYWQRVREKRGISRFMVTVKLACASLVYAMAVPVCACLGEHTLMNCLLRGGYYLSGFCAPFGVELVKKRDCY